MTDYYHFIGLNDFLPLALQNVWVTAKVKKCQYDIGSFF